MPDIKLTTDDGGTEFARGVGVTLKAEASGGKASDWSWKRDQAAVEGNQNHLDIVVGEKTVGTYVATSKVKADGARDPIEVRSNELEITMAADEAPKPEQPDWHLHTAVIVAICLGLVAAVLALILRPWEGSAGLSATDWASLDGRLKLAATVTLPLIVLGATVVLIGVWMAIVEWRGRFRVSKASGDSKQRGAPEDLPKIIEAVGKLQGAALVLVIGVLVLFAAAWIAQSAVGTSSASASAAPSATASAGPSAS